MNEKLDELSFVLYAAKHYINPGCLDTDEFFNDLKRFKYLKRLFNKYHETGELKERLILNHIIVIYNVFGPTRVENIGIFGKDVDCLDIRSDANIEKVLKSI